MKTFLSNESLPVQSHNDTFMKIPKLFLFLVAAFLAIGPLAAPRAHAQVTVGFFYDSLDPYGEWIQTADYGYVWQPTGVADNWAPYTDGYWAYTDSGWTWVSYEDYGGVVYHYGRWTNLADVGWVWVPGNTWAPAWVSWRTSDDYVGWAPLPPEARWHAGFGFNGAVDVTFDIGPGFYSFVGVHDFGAPALGAVIINREQNVNIITNTTNITNITVNNSNVFVGGPSYAKFSALSSRPIPALKLVRQGDAAAIHGAGGKLLAHQEGNQLMVLAPKITAPAGGALPTPPKVAKTLGHVTATHGWDGVKDPQVREKLQAQFKQQAGSSAKEPARPVNPEDLKVVKNKAEGASKGLAAGGATPKTGKSKKARTPSLTDLENAPAKEEPATAGETPKTAKTKSKSKKAKTPSDHDTGDADSGTPSKHKKESTDSDLQPFMSGDSSEPKSKKNSEDSEKNVEDRGRESDHPAGEARTPRAKKSDKKPKEEEGNPTPQ